MKNTLRLLCWALVVVLSAFVLGCARTEMTAFENPQFAGQSFNTVLVEGGFADLGRRQYSEGQLCDQMAEYAAVTCMQSLKVFFPGQTYTQRQVNETLTRLHVDGLLFLRPTGSNVTPVYLPTTTYTTGQATAFGNTAYGSSTTQTFGGAFFLKNASFEAIFYAIPTDKVAWYGTAASHGNAFANWDDVIESATEETVKKMVAEGALPAAKN